ncbi:alpha/beta hydrolase [Streptomyces chartreusis]|uniref:alpha/beta fold hydrolase n=1 Tax=Streptomyces chartreusis TaxID=1969 RepID=UPI002E7FD08F|nr:alpha/beta hydrolase [Streptomyces chartreusis]WUB23848.1 alpha/beta hydrolase [Streptomyces chartreusis]
MSTTVENRFSDTALANSLDGDFASHYADVNGTRLHYVVGGSGEPLFLLGGWPQTWWQWNKVMPELARHYRVFAVDLRGMGSSAKPAEGYDKKTMARDIYELARHLGLERVHIAGHDIGAMVAYAHAANHPEATGKIALLDVPHPDDGWSSFGLLPEPDQHVDSAIEVGERSYLWWFAFNQVKDLPAALLEGRIRLLVDWLFERQAKDPGSIDDYSREVYARAYESAEAVRAGNAWYQAFHQDIVDARSYAPVSAPTLALGGDESNYAYLRDLMPTKATDVRVVEVASCGHYVPEEQPQSVIDELIAFLD